MYRKKSNELEAYKNREKIAFLESVLKKINNDYDRKLVILIEQYIEAHKHNIIGNNPETILKKLNEFWPELTEYFENIRKQLCKIK